MIFENFYSYTSLLAPTKKRVKATHPYAGDGQTKLQLDVGDTVQLLIPQPRDGWHYGENEKSGLRGWFPIQYTTKVRYTLLLYSNFWI